MSSSPGNVRTRSNRLCDIQALKWATKAQSSLLSTTAVLNFAVRMQRSKLIALRSEERRVGKECRSLCDWSSDVCSSDLYPGFEVGYEGTIVSSVDDGGLEFRGTDATLKIDRAEIGRASCRERV